MEKYILDCIENIQNNHIIDIFYNWVKSRKIFNELIELQIQFEIGSNADAAVQTKNKNKTKLNDNNNSNNRTEEEKSDVIINKVNRNQKYSNENALLEYSQDIVDKVLDNLKDELKVKLNDSKLDKLVLDTKQILNQFQNLTYTRALFAQQGLKRL